VTPVFMHFKFYIFSLLFITTMLIAREDSRRS